MKAVRNIMFVLVVALLALFGLVVVENGDVPNPARVLSPAVQVVEGAVDHMFSFLRPR
jgi:hypothetical protein